MNKRLSNEERKQQILETLAKMLENNNNNKITTANIANYIGASEATLYRHFDNKEAMFKELIDFAERSIFVLINKINNVDNYNTIQIQQIIAMLLKFAEQNPGIIHLVVNSELISKSQILGEQSQQFFRRLKAQFKQNLQLLCKFKQCDIDCSMMADMMAVFVIGKWQQFVFSNFKDSPMIYWQQQWLVFEKLLIN